ncbi:hypothetical protein BS78_01G237400 [Paspalum vaginatum]|nr:hypothetical protein BS78_01G237400 [Paspalum vaginatum]
MARNSEAGSERTEASLASLLVGHMDSRRRKRGEGEEASGRERRRHGKGEEAPVQRSRWREKGARRRMRQQEGEEPMAQRRSWQRERGRQGGGLWRWGRRRGGRGSGRRGVADAMARIRQRGPSPRSGHGGLVGQRKRSQPGQGGGALGAGRQGGDAPGAAERRPVRSSPWS